MENQQPLQWFVLSCYTHHESQVEERLQQQADIQYYLPKKQAVRKFQGKFKQIWVPMIPGIVFAQGTYQQIQGFQQLCSYTGFVTKLDGGHRKVMVVPNGQMQSFITVVQQYNEQMLYFRPEELPLRKGQFVSIIGGPFNGVKGELLKVKGKRSKCLVVRIPDLAAIAVSIEPEYIQLISEEEFLKA